jgi:TolB protein
MLRIFLGIVFAAFLLQPDDGFGQKRSEVGGKITTGPTIQLLSVGIENFRASGGFATVADSTLASNMQQILEDDLAFSLYFNVVKVDTSFLENFAQGKMTIDDWIYLGAQMLISGLMEHDATAIVLSVNVTDTYRDKNVYNRDYVGEPQKYRYLMHSVAADLLRNLTGEEGSYFSKIAYSSDTTDHPEIYICDFDGYGVQQITHDNSIDVIPSWAIDGSRIFYTSYKNNNPDLYAYDVAGDKSLSFSARKGLNMGAAVSPDGKYIAVTLTLSGNSDIYLLDQSGRIVKQLTFSPMIDTAPSWSPSSREIVFTSDKTGSPQIYITDLDGINTRRMTFQGDYNDEPAWSPRGDLIAYTSRAPDGFEIFTIDITGQFPHQLTEVGYNETPSWSPDGLHIVFSSNVSGTYKLNVMNYNGLDRKQLDLPGSCKTPNWSRNLK